MKTSEKDSKPNSSGTKKEWTPPFLTELGDIRKITKGANFGITDSGEEGDFAS